MEAQTANFRPVRLSTDDLPERDRVPMWREFFGRRLLYTEIEPAPDVPFHIDMTVRSVPGIHITSSLQSPVCLTRTSALVAADGNDDVGMLVTTSGGTAAQCGRETLFDAGDAVVMSGAEAGTCATPTTARYRCLHMSRTELAPLVTNLDDAALLRIAPNNEALQYLLSYIRFLEEQHAWVDPHLAQAAALHLRDLFALVLGAKRDAAFVARDRGLRAARLQAIKCYIMDNLSDGRLSVGAVATRHGATPRYLQRLFEGEGTTFSEYVLNQRLTRVRQMLTDLRYASWTVSAIAFEAGFGDVSYFNRRFRRRFSATPTDIRVDAQAESARSKMGKRVT